MTAATPESKPPEPSPAPEGDAPPTMPWSKHEEECRQRLREELARHESPMEEPKGGQKPTDWLMPERLSKEPSPFGQKVDLNNPLDWT
jgi:hypothetical protein